MFSPLVTGFQVGGGDLWCTKVLATCWRIPKPLITRIGRDEFMRKEGILQERPIEAQRLRQFMSASSIPVS